MNSPAQQLESTSDAEVLAALQDIASRENVEGVALPCVELLTSDNEEIRGWASEALTNSVWATESDVPELMRRLDEIANATPTPTNAFVADQLYWISTLLGRIGPPAAACTDLLTQLAEGSTDTTNDPWSSARQRANWALNRIG